jgi:large subunit ribosomal protein L9
MEVILLERIGRLGGMGDVVKVKNGYARNFLIPQKKALRATDENKKVFDARRAEMEKSSSERKAEADKLAKKLSGVSVKLVRQASEDGKLFGSVGSRDVAESLSVIGHSIDRKIIEINGVVKNTGAYQVKITLHPEVIVSITMNVVRNESDKIEEVPAELTAPAEDAAGEEESAA